MIDSPALVSALKAQVLTLEDDLRMRVDALPEVSDLWRAEHHRVVEAERTASSWTEWRDDRVTQAAVAWVLTTVFIRFCEDNGLVKPVWIAGPPSRRQEALDGQLAFFRTEPEATDREWVLDAVSYLKRLPSTAALVDEHSPLWSVSPSGGAVTALLAFWRQRDADGQLRWEFADVAWSTRFLGDLYQDLSDHAKKTYALLQTPEFVEEFILDQTLEPALKERPLDGFSMIDPTCGSGHFLLGTFARLLERWGREAPGLELQVRVQKALDAVHGVDLNPFAVAIARFRLTVAALQASDLTSFERAPTYSYHLAAGDSLLFGRWQESLSVNGPDEDSARSAMVMSAEDAARLTIMLEPGTYDAVVGNPPYVKVSDQMLNRAYRKRYSACDGSYALSVPFMQRFFELAKPSVGDLPPGRIGQITSNSFMKRSFGGRLIRDFLPTRDLLKVIDCEGVWIPGHNMDGTPTVIIVGRNSAPMSTKVRTILGKGLRESKAVGSHGSGSYWQSIVNHCDDSFYDDDWVTVSDVDRQTLAEHPWILAGGGAVELIKKLRAVSTPLRRASAKIGYGVVTREDEAYLLGSDLLRRKKVQKEHIRGMVEGKNIRNHSIHDVMSAAWPYNPVTIRPELDSSTERLLWPLKPVLESRVAYGKTQLDSGKHWYEYSMYFRERYAAGSRVIVPEIASHNHFVIDRSDNLHKHTSILIIFDESIDPVAQGIVAALNSSIVCFWLRHNSKAKGGAGDDPAARTHQYTKAILEEVPLPSRGMPKIGPELQRSADELHRIEFALLFRDQTPTRAILDDLEEAHSRIVSELVYLQEELDWECYSLSDLTTDCLIHAGPHVSLPLGARTFELEFPARQAGLEDWPQSYTDIVVRRQQELAGNPALKLLETPAYKRRWIRVSWPEMEKVALRRWVLGKLDSANYWFSGPTPRPMSVGQLADRVERDPDLLAVLNLLERRSDVPVVVSLTRLLEPEGVPYLAALRMVESGSEKYLEWLQGWEEQRRRDRGEQLVVAALPRYRRQDFRKASYWTWRGELDLQRERFIVYPNAGRATDPTILVGWAGWDHAEQSLALASIIGEREAEGRPDDDLVPLVAGLAELQPWVEQWHAEVHPIYGQSLAVFCREQLADRCRQVNLSVEQLAAWRPPATTRGRKAKT